MTSSPDTIAPSVRVLGVTRTGVTAWMLAAVISALVWWVLISFVMWVHGGY